MKYQIAAFVLVAMCSAELRAAEFEYRGFKQGMTSAQANDVANRQGYELKPTRGIPDLISIKQAGVEVGKLQFCQDQITIAYYTVSVGFHHFVKQLEDLEKGSGLRRAGFNFMSQLGYDGEQRSELSADFVPDGGGYFVRAQLFATESKGVSNYQISYIGPGKCQ